MDQVNIKELVSEFTGSLSIALVGVMSTSVVGKDDEKHHLLMLGAIVLIVTTIFYTWSGSHFNPYITVGKMITSPNPSWVKMISYIVVQLLGAAAGAYMVTKLLDHDIEPQTEEEDEYLKTHQLYSILIDGFFTFLLVLSYLELTNRLEFSIGVGLIISAIYLTSREFSKGMTGGNINIGTKLATSIISKNYTHLLLTMIGPIIGVVVAVCAYSLLHNSYPFGSISKCLFGKEESPESRMREYDTESQTT